MREKSPRLIVTFHTTAGAIATEQLCRRLGLEGKLISVPRCITSDCGMAWSAPPELREHLETRLQEAGIEFTDDQVTWIDFNNDETKAQSTAADFLTAHPDSRKILFGVLTDPASAGVLAAIETAKRSDDCMIVSHGGEDVGIEMLKKDNCFQGTVCYDPAKYGEGLIPLAVRIIHGEQAEVYNYAQQYMLTRDNLG